MCSTYRILDLTQKTFKAKVGLFHSPTNVLSNVLSYIKNLFLRKLRKVRAHIFYVIKFEVGKETEVQ